MHEVRKAMTPSQLKGFAYVMANLDRDTLEQARIMKPGQVGGGDWERFNADPITFILKLPPGNLAKLAQLVTLEMDETP
jgi:hypothetical protein